MGTNVNLVPPAPEAAALGKFGEIPIGTYTGTPQISIPLHNIQSRGLSLPISLDYHASGIKVDEIASSVGLGWSLLAGGVITRVVNGLPDETPARGFWNTDHTLIDSLYNIYPQVQDSLLSIGLELVMGGFTETTPDQYFFNFGTYAGKMLVTPNQEAYAIPYQKLKIEIIGQLEKWIITDPQGIQYVFDQKEYTFSDTECGNSGQVSPSYAPTSWYLSKVYNPTKTDSISLHYTDGQIVYDQGISEMSYHQTSPGNTLCGSNDNIGCCPDRNNEYCISQMIVQSKKLHTITSVIDTVFFLSEQQVERKDLQGSHRIAEIEIHRNGQLLKGFKLEHSYFESQEIGTPTLLSNLYSASDPRLNYMRYRLKLDQVTEWAYADSNQCTSRPPFKFEYNTTHKLPPRYSAAVDHWGFYNGQNNNTLLPQILAPQGASTNIPGANREVNPQYLSAGMLQKITYPTGGQLSFVFEPHQYGWHNQTQITSSFQLQTLAAHTNENQPISTQSFQVSLPQYIRVNYALSNAYGIISQNANNQCRVAIADASSATLHEYTLAQNSNGSFDEIYLTPGNYFLQSFAPDSGDIAQISIQWTDSSHQTGPLYAGGLRIKQTIQYDDLDSTRNIVKNYQYFHTADTTQSSGVVLNLPRYTYTRTYSNQEIDDDNPTPLYVYEWLCSYLTRFATSKSPLRTTKGQYVGYAEVHESLGHNLDLGYTTYYYTTARNYPDQVTNRYPFPPATSFEWRRGLLTEKHEFDQSGNLIRKQENQYHFAQGDTNRHEVKGLAVAYLRDYYINHAQLHDIFWVEGYKQISEWIYLTQQRETIYYPQGDSLSQTIKYHYENPEHAQLTTVERQNSDGTILYSTTQYPADIGRTTSSSTIEYIQAINTLHDQHVHALPIEKQEWVSSFVDNDKRLAKAQLFEYKDFGTNQIQLHHVSETIHEHPLFDFTPAHIDTNTNQWVTDARYQLKYRFNKYSSNGKLLETQPHHGRATTYIWDKNEVVPIAKIQNSVEPRTAYLNFESEQQEYFTYPANRRVTTHKKTGKYGIYLNASTGIVYYPPTTIPEKMRITFWATAQPYVANVTPYARLISVSEPDSNGFRLYEYHQDYIQQHNIIHISQVSTGLPTYIDDLRITPFNSHMTTYAYDQNLQLSSETSPNQLTTHYEYDTFNRLTTTRNEDNHILSHTSYNYKNSNQLVADFSIQSPPIYNQNITFDASSVCAPDDGLTTYTWNFGDGNTATGMVITHNYAAPDTYDIQLTVTHPNYQTDSHTYPLAVGYLPLQASFSQTTTTIPANQTATFSTNPTGGVAPYTYDWYVIDPAAGLYFWTHQSNSNNSLSYSSSCDFSIKCVVHDSLGNSQTLIQQVNVTNNPNPCQY